MKTVYALYMRYSPRHNWILQGTTSDGIDRHNYFVSILQRDCLSNKNGWLDRHPNFQIGEWILEWDDKNTLYPSWDVLDNRKPNDKNIKIVLEDRK